MVKKIGVLVVLAAAGVAIAMYLRGGFTPEKAAEQAFTPRSDASETERITDLERALAAQVERANQLESRLAQLEGGAGERRGNRADGEVMEAVRERVAEARRQVTDANGNFDPVKMQERRREQQLERFVRAGFTRERAEWIERRMQELEVQSMQAQYDAQRTGQPGRNVDPESALRREIGDTEYEKYLNATGRPTQVQVLDVLASSAAERSGLQAGDQIVSYAGQRVFDMRELNTLTRQGTPGESVTVEVQRNGQTMQVQVPRGVLGVQGGGMRGQGGGMPRNRPAFGGGPGGGGPPGGGG